MPDDPAVPPARFPYQSPPRPRRAPDAPAADAPAEPDVYGGQWGDSGQEKTPGPPPADRPDKIETPPEKN